MCDPYQHTETPVGELCAYCWQNIVDGDQGLMIPHLDPVLRDKFSAWHLDCYLRSIGLHGWHRP